LKSRKCVLNRKVSRYFLTCESDWNFSQSGRSAHHSPWPQISSQTDTSQLTDRLGKSHLKHAIFQPLLSSSFNLTPQQQLPPTAQLTFTIPLKYSRHHGNRSSSSRLLHCALLRRRRRVLRPLQIRTQEYLILPFPLTLPPSSTFHSSCSLPRR
jgi:hypothetical protein